jgi:hypothetical protein
MMPADSFLIEVVPLPCLIARPHEDSHFRNASHARNFSA